MNSNAKLTPAQINEQVQHLTQVVFTGNGEPSLREMMRTLQRGNEETHKLLIDNIAKWEENDKAYKEEKTRLEKEKYDSLIAHQLELKNSKIFWSRTLGVLVVTQVLQWAFLWIVQ